MESRPNTPSSPLGPNDIGAIQTAVTGIQNSVKNLLQAMTPAFKNKFDPDLNFMMRFKFNESTTTTKDLGDFIKCVDEYMELIEMISMPMMPASLSETPSATQRLVVKEAEILMQSSFYKTIEVNTAIIKDLTGPWVDFMIGLSASKQRQQDMVPVFELEKAIQALVEETEKRIRETYADPLRLKEMQYLQTEVAALLKNPTKASPRQLLTDCCLAIEKSVKSMRDSTYGGYSTTATKLETLLTNAKQYALRGIDAETENETANVTALLMMVKSFLDDKWNAFWAERNNPRGVVAMRKLILQPIGDQEKWKQIKALAVIRMNTKTLMGYPVSSRHTDTANFYFHISKSNLAGLKALQSDIEQRLIPTQRQAI